jgi:hypothetical protein
MGTPQRLRAMGHMVTPEPSRTGRWVWSRRTRDNTGALPYRAVGPVARGDDIALPHWKAGLEPRDKWWHRSPSLPGGVPGATRYVAMPELSSTRSGSGAAGTRDFTRAIPYRVRSLAL